MAAPLGPVGILCISRALAEGPPLGFVCGLGAAVADTLYALAGTVALAAIAQWVIDDRTVLRLIGGIFLVYLGARTFMRPPLVLPAAARLPAPLPPGARAAFKSTFLLTLANPVAPARVRRHVRWTGHRTGRGDPRNRQRSGLGRVGRICGIRPVVARPEQPDRRVRQRIGTRTLTFVNRVSGTVLTAFGLYAFALLLPLP